MKKRIAKRVLPPALALLMVLSITACESASDESDTGNAKENASSTNTPENVDPMGKYEKPITM